MNKLNLTNITFLSGSNRYFHIEDSKDKATFFVHKYFTSGDYTGGAIEAANRRVMLENTELCERLGIEELCESYSTETLLFPIASLEDPELIEIFQGLEDYASLDDDAVSEVERELEDECWESFGRRDFKRHIESIATNFKSLVEGLDPELADSLIEDFVGSLSVKDLDLIYQELNQNSHYNIFQVESGTSGYFNFDSFGGQGKESAEKIIESELVKLKKVKA